MEETIVSKLQPLLPEIIALSKKKKSIVFDYDEPADVLYISFVKPQQATDTEIISDDILVRKRKDKIVGVTILHASDFTQKQK